MVANSRLNVFTGQPVTDVRLGHSPLERVLCQLRWEPFSQLKFRFDDIAQQLSLAISDDFPFSDKEREMTFTVTPEGVSQSPGPEIWRYVSKDRASRVSFSDTFFAFETTAYDGRDAFAAKFMRGVESLASIVNIPAWNRLGYRYTNRLTGDDAGRIHEYFNEAVVGGNQLGGDSIAVEHSVSETVYSHGENKLLVRTAVLSAGQVIDPSIPALEGEKSFLLDLDASVEQLFDGFETREIEESVRSVSRFAHDYFEAVITDQFVERYS